MRDKVKRFISILMTALMLVNLMPVGALADGITSIGYKPEVAASTGNHTVYVYARFDGDPLPGVTLNASQWYTDRLYCKREFAVSWRNKLGAILVLQ